MSVKWTKNGTAENLCCQASEVELQESYQNEKNMYAKCEAPRSTLVDVFIRCHKTWIEAFLPAP